MIREVIKETSSVLCTENTNIVGSPYPFQSGSDFWMACFIQQQEKTLLEAEGESGPITLTWDTLASIPFCKWCVCICKHMRQQYSPMFCL